MFRSATDKRLLSSARRERTDNISSAIVAVSSSVARCAVLCRLNEIPIAFGAPPVLGGVTSSNESRVLLSVDAAEFLAVQCAVRRMRFKRPGSFLKRAVRAPRFDGSSDAIDRAPAEAKLEPLS